MLGMRRSIPVFKLQSFNSFKFTRVVRYGDAFVCQGCSGYQDIIGSDRFASIFEISTDSCCTFHFLVTKRQNIDGSGEAFQLKPALLWGTRFCYTDFQLKKHDGGNADASWRRLQE